MAKESRGGFCPVMSLLMDERMGTAVSGQQNNAGMVIIPEKERASP